MYKIKLTELSVKLLKSLDKKTQSQIANKIKDLQIEPLKRGKQLKGNLSEFRSIRSAGQRYRIIYQVKGNELIVIVIAVGIRKDGDKKDIYSLLKKYINLDMIEH